MDIRTILSTEMRLLEPICEFIGRDGYQVYRSEKFPNFYGGNGVDIEASCGRSLTAWEDVFHEFFDPVRFGHITFTFPYESWSAPLLEQARRASYNVAELTEYMFVDHTGDCRPVPEGYAIRKVESEEDWGLLARFAEASYADGDWYDPAARGPDRLFEKTRFTSEAIGIDWFYLTPEGEPEVLAKLGIFSHRGICRLQDVETAASHRRKGFATVLVSFAIRHAIETLGATGVALCADSDYHAVHLYGKLGFVECGRSVTLMKYPVRNPLHLAGTVADS